MFLRPCGDRNMVSVTSPPLSRPIALRRPERKVAMEVS